MVPPDQQLFHCWNNKPLWNLEYNNCFKQYLFFHIHATVSLLQLFKTFFFLKPPNPPPSL